MRAAQPSARRTDRAEGTESRPLQLAPVLALAGLGVAAIVTLAFLLGSPGFGSAPGATQTEPPRTPDPSVVVTPPPPQQEPVKGWIVFAKAGRLWSISGTTVTRLKGTANLSSPSWSTKGDALFAIEHRVTHARVPYQGRAQRYRLNYPLVVRMKPDGSGLRVVKNGLYSLGGDDRRWFTWLLQPAVSPDGRNLAVISDAPEPFQRDPTLSLLSTSGGQVRNLNLPEQRPLGHSDPAWSPDGKRIAYTHNLGDLGQGQPKVAVYTVATRGVRDLTRAGYAQPSWSPDGRYLAAVRTTGEGRDLVVLDAATGAELARLTRDGLSFAPVWSPDGRQIAFLRLGKMGADLRLITLANGVLRVESDKPLTQDDSLDATSRPTWFIPADQRG